MRFLSRNGSAGGRSFTRELKWDGPPKNSGHDEIGASFVCVAHRHRHHKRRTCVVATNRCCSSCQSHLPVDASTGEQLFHTGTHWPTSIPASAVGVASDDLEVGDVAARCTVLAACQHRFRRPERIRTISVFWQNQDLRKNPGGTAGCALTVANEGSTTKVLDCSLCFLQCHYPLIRPQQHIIRNYSYRVIEYASLYLVLHKEEVEQKVSTKIPRLLIAALIFNAAEHIT